MSVWMSIALVALVFAAFAIAAFFVAWISTATFKRGNGSPTPDEAKIEAKTKADAVAIVNEGEKEKTEVLHADRDGLLARLRDRVRGK